MSTFRLPDLGEGLQEAEIVAWHVAEGDHVVADQPLLSVETEKAVVEIPSPRAGYVARLLVHAGEHVKIGAPLLAFEEAPHAETGTVVGELAKPALAPTPSGQKTALASPAVRARARELGVEIAALKGSGPGETITRADVESAATAVGTNEPLRGARRTMARNMTRAWREVVHATLHDWADTAGWPAEQDIMVRLIRAIVAGCAAVPALNASFDAAAVSLRHNARIDLGLAIDSSDGLLVPVIRDVGNKGPEQLRLQIEAAKAGVKNRGLSPNELRDATITLSNFGPIAGQFASLIVVPPQVAILGAGRLTDQAVQAGQELCMHGMLPLSLSFDHRAVTGGEAARFLRAVIGDLEQPA